MKHLYGVKVQRESEVFGNDKKEDYKEVFITADDSRDAQILVENMLGSGFTVRTVRPVVHPWMDSDNQK